MRKFREILRKHVLYLEGCADGVRANLSYADLNGADLRYTDLLMANLRGVDLSGVSLRDADLHGARLDDTCLDPANTPSGAGAEWECHVTRSG